MNRTPLLAGDPRTLRGAIHWLLIFALFRAPGERQRPARNLTFRRYERVRKTVPVSANGFPSRKAVNLFILNVLYSYFRPLCHRGFLKKNKRFTSPVGEGKPFDIIL